MKSGHFIGFLAFFIWNESGKLLNSSAMLIDFMKKPLKLNNLDAGIKHFYKIQTVTIEGYTEKNNS